MRLLRLSGCVGTGIGITLDSLLIKRILVFESALLFALEVPGERGGRDNVGMGGRIV